MNVCNECGVYTRTKSDNCSICTKDLETESYQFDQKFNVEPLNYVKGHIAEGIVRNLLTSMGFKVFKYGIENSLPIISDFELFGAKRKSFDFKLVSSRPDLFVFNEDKKTAYLIEVKYRNSNYPLSKILADDYPYQNALIAIVSSNEIRIIKALELQSMDSVEFMKDKYLIENFTEFNLDKGLVDIFKKHIQKTYRFLDKSNEAELKKQIKKVLKNGENIEVKIEELLFQ